jgi:general secretion pathway protein K
MPGYRALHDTLRRLPCAGPAHVASRHRSRGGFVLLAVLWVMVGVTALGLALALSARGAIRAAENRRAETIATWRAEGCAERARSVMEAVLDGQGATMGVQPVYSRAGWRALDRTLAESPLLRSNDCAVSLRAAGSAIDVDIASEELLHDFFTALDLPPALSDSLVDALLDWRDPDDLPRPFGAERAWYEREGRVPPRNGPLQDARELATIRGFSALPGIDSMLGVEPGRIDLGHAPLPVLAALPGFTSEAVSRVAEERLRGVELTNILSLGARLSPNARSILVSRYAELARLTVIEPDAWILTSRARAGEPAITTAVELRLVRAGSRAAIVRRRSWVE